MNIVMATDDNYADIMATSIYSIGKNNQWTEIKFYVIDAGISAEKKLSINNIVNRYNNITITYIDFENYGLVINNLVKRTEPPLPLITFARLFIADMINEEKILYVDCDTICNGSVEEFWNTDLSGMMIAGVQDTVSEEIKTKIGLTKSDHYINAGIILIDLDKWRLNKCTEKAVDYINKHNGYVMHNDQGVINALFKNDIKIVSPKYNAMTPLFMINRAKIMKYFALDNYYSAKEIKEAVDNPVFIHFVRFTTSRPWETGCAHPYKASFETNWEQSGLGALALQPYNISNITKIIFFFLNHFPYPVYIIIKKIISILSNVKQTITRNRDSLK